MGFRDFVTMEDILDIHPVPPYLTPAQVGKVFQKHPSTVRRALDACGLQHLVAHDWRRAWTMNHIDAEGPRRRAAIGKQSESGEAPYIHFNRQEQEELYGAKWAEFEDLEPWKK